MRLLIYPRFQLTLLAANVLIMGLVLAFVGLQISRSFAELQRLGVAAGLSPSHAYFKFLNFQSGNLSSYLVIGFGVGIVISTFLSLLISHRVAGPIVRLRGYFGSIAKEPHAKIYPLKFRKGDFFSELPPVINGALGQLGGDKEDKTTRSA